MRSSGHDDAPLFVPTEFQAEHLDDARRRIANSLGARRVAQRVSSTVTGARERSRGRRALRHVLLAQHVIAALLTLAISAVMGTWAVGLTVVALIAVSFAVLTRIVTTVDPARVRAVLDQRSTHGHGRPPT